MTARVAQGGLRVADADRDRCVEQLQQEFVTGRLEQWEFEERVERALRARSRDQLDELTSDCEDDRVPSSRTLSGRLRVGIVGLVGAVALGGEPALYAGTAADVRRHGCRVSR